MRDFISRAVRVATLSFWAVVIPQALATAQVVETVVGGGPLAPSRSDLVAEGSDLSIDAAGRLVLNANGRIYAVDSTGHVHVLAGSGVETETGLYPFAVPSPLMPVHRAATELIVPGRLGEYYVAQRGAYGSQLARVTLGSGGTQTHIAGRGAPEPEQNGVPALQAVIHAIGGLVPLSNGDLLIASRTSIRRISASTGLITLAAAGFDGGNVVDVDAAPAVDDPIYIATERRVFRATANPPGWLPVAGTGLEGSGGDGGPALAATFSLIADIAVAPNGDVYVADLGARRVRRFTPGGSVVTVAGTGVRGFSGDGMPAPLAQLDGPRGIVIDSNSVLSFVDGYRVRQIDGAGNINTFIGSGRRVVEGRSGREATLLHPVGVAVAPGGGIVVADTDNSRIRRWDAVRDIVETVAGDDSSLGLPNIQTDPSLIPAFVPIQPRYVASDSLGRIYFAGDAYEKNNGVYTGPIRAVVRLEPDAARHTVLTTALRLYAYGSPVAADAAGRVYVATLDGVFRVDGPGATPVFVHAPSSTVHGLAVDGNGVLYIAANNLYAVQITTGLTQVLFSGAYARAVAVDGNGNVFYAGLDRRVYRRTPAGVVSSWAGSDHPLWFTGDLTPAAEASFSFLFGLAVDQQGRVLVSDNLNHRIRRVTTSGGGVPGAPTGLAASVSGHTVSLLWQPPTTGVPPTGYELLARVSASGPPVVVLPVGAVTTFSVAGPDGTFHLTVRGSNAFGPGPESAAVTVSLPALGSPPSTPQAFQAVVSGQLISMTWQPPASSGSSPVTGYLLEAGSDAGGSNLVILRLGPISSFASPPVPDGSYYLRLRAVNAGGAGPPSAEVRAVVGQPPPSAPILSGEASAGGTVSLRWTVPSAGSPPTGYRLVAGSAPGLADIAVVSLSSTTTTLAATAIPAGRYYVRVVAISAAGLGAVSNEVMLTVL